MRKFRLSSCKIYLNTLSCQITKNTNNHYLINYDFQSVFPPKLTLGQSKRHHAVVYLHAKLKSDFTACKMNSDVRIDPGEVGACAWFDKSMVKAIVSAREEGTSQGSGLQNVCDTFR